MQSVSQAPQTKLAAITILSLLLLLAFAVGAQAAVAAHFSNGSAATTPAAGTQGRGGALLIAGATTTTGGGAGGVAFAFSRPRGAFLPVPQAGNVPRAAVSPGSPTPTDWIAVAAILAFATAVVVLLSSISRRRTRRDQSALASYCARNPSDSLCRAT